jgi:hypothetical protein
MKKHVRINFEFPRSEYPYLKMICAEKGVSLKEFATDLLLQAIEEYEDRILSERSDKKLQERRPQEDIPSDEFWKLLSQDDEDKI